jgi:hypothetical protein
MEFIKHSRRLVGSWEDGDHVENTNLKSAQDFKNEKQSSNLSIALMESRFK